MYQINVGVGPPVSLQVRATAAAASEADAKELPAAV